LKRTAREIKLVVLFLRAQLSKRVAAVAYVINEPCIGVKDNSCVEVCPVDCIHPTPDEPDWDQHDQLFIDPAECIDCDACVEACPVDAITPLEEVPPEWQRFIALNAAYYTSR
jgi:ferredoxin